MADYVAIKGARGGIRVVIDDACTWADALGDLHKQMQQGASLMQGMRISLDLGARQLESADMDALRSMLHGYNIETVDVHAESTDMRQIARAVGFTARPRGINASKEPMIADTPRPILMRNLRSGQVYKHLHGDLTLLGDVNAGAELVVSGSVVVFGRVRGIVHAGAMGDRSAIICAIELAATQIRIADVRARAPEDDTHRTPEIACIEDGQIIVQTWEEYRR
ncbi:MAG: septum site-determining protein MinC [Roseiflexaceae bacterium]